MAQKTIIGQLLDKARASDPIHVALPKAKEVIGLAPKRSGHDHRSEQIQGLGQDDQAQGTSTSSSTSASEGVPRFADLRQQLKAQDHVSVDLKSCYRVSLCDFIGSVNVTVFVDIMCL